jgi:hypothetical protein
MANSKNSGKVLAERPLRGVKAGTIQHSTTYELSKDGMFEQVARKGNANYRAPDRFVPGNPDFESGVTQNVGSPAQSDGLRGAISLIRGK